MTFLSALILGLLASSHCAGMCGGLQMALQGDVVLRSRQQMLIHVFWLNAGRLLTYVLLGLLLTGLGLTVVNSLGLANIAHWVRIASGTVIILLGVQLLLKGQRPFQSLERLGAKLWQRISRFIPKAPNSSSQSLVTGMLWGFLPCGLVYGVLLLAVLGNDLTNTGLLMLGFGLGTLPALLFTGVFYQHFRRWVNKPGIQVSGGAFFVIGGLVMVSAPWWVNQHFLYDYPELLNLVFCVT